MDVNKKQKLLLEYLISSVDTYCICKSITQPDYFTTDYKKVVRFIHEYYDQYSALPTTDQILVETDVQLKTQEITKDAIKYCTNEIEKFCKQKAITSAVIKASSLIEDEDYGKIEQLIRDAVSVSLHRDLGIQYFEDPLARLESSCNTSERISTGWNDVDTCLGGGLARTEILLLSANSGGGKSVTLANLAVNYVHKKLNVLYITLELAETMVSQRFDTMFTGVSPIVWQPHIHDTADKIDKLKPNVGSLVIKWMGSGTNANQIRSYLKEYELVLGMVPDVLIVDYLDIMGTNEKVSADNVWEKDKRATEQLRDILFDYNMIGATASQQNRAAIDATELNQGHIAGGITKVNTVDWYVSVVMTPAMKASGDIIFVFLKTRSSDAVGKSVSLHWDNNQLRITDTKRENNDDDFLQKAVTNNRQLTQKKSLMDIFDV